MKNYFFTICTLFFSAAMFSQAGHIMQGVGSVNMSMGGAATAQPLDISGALHWNPATISAFDDNIIKLDVGLFFSSPELSSTVPEFGGDGQPTGNFFSGVTEDDRGLSPMPALAMVWSKPDSKHTFGVSAFGISGFGVTFPESTTNPITMPQSMGGFGRIESNYMLLQVGFVWAYELSDKFSIGLQPTLDYASLELEPNPTANPNQAGYPTADQASAIGFGGQIGLFYDSGAGFKAGVSYKTTQYFGDFELENTYLDNSEGTNDFNMDYPAILSLGLGYSLGNIDLAVDYRMVDYENTDGFSEVGWTQTASVAGFGWENINIISAGIQYKGVDKFPIRVGYTYSSNPINSDVAFFNVPATAIIKNAFQVGFSYEISDRFTLDALYHYGSSGDATSGQLLNPQFAQNFPPYGAIPGSEVSYDMTTSMVAVGASLKLGK
ncbi:OmpP1/FadL family transporter [Flagellimonas nanhaiensis]|uniref:Hydrocarbon degradation protein n=1 Tax=Flagellimonas nanhaiensis TaxID=2292706 RepID=A0A371JUA0_9FLAO|nr:outer membrane protein transport protein [Allomuricauda nanhaiensis]RDY61378.1 hydrocarbon degradation protein [Allomuricauda nanhaiensis]